MPAPDPNAEPAAPDAAPSQETVVAPVRTRHADRSTLDEGGELTQVQQRPPAHLPATKLLPVVPGFAVERELARGGMGVVYKAHDPAFGRDVAVKVMHAGQNAERFVVEARTTARLPHPGIPPVYALGELADGRPFLAMKLIEGRTLADDLKTADRKSDFARLLSVFKRVCETVGFAHSKGVVHRDLKPSNVMVGAFGEVQVMDWGLAKAEGRGQTTEDAEGKAEVGLAAAGGGAHSADLTEVGRVKGTPAYMAPEQARGEPVDARADVFALGGILALLLAGRPPFVGSDVADTIQKAARAELGACFAALDACDADAELVAAAKRCLSADPGERFPNAQELAGAVLAYRAGVEVRLWQAERERAAAEAKAAEELNTRREAEARLGEQRKRRQVQLALAVLVVAFALAVSFAGTWVQNRRAADQLAADRAAAAKQREGRAEALVQALASAETASVPRLITDLAEYRDLSAEPLRELARQPVHTKPGLHARLALLGDDPARAPEVADYLPACLPEEVLTVRRLLAPHAAAVGPGLWRVLSDEGAEPGRRVRAAGALAGLAADDPRWPGAAAPLVGLLARERALQGAVWANALEPVRAHLMDPLAARYALARERIHGGRLSEAAFVAEARGFDLTANMLARYSADRPDELARLAVTVDGRHHALLAAALSAPANRARVLDLLRGEAARTPPAGAGEADLGAHAKRRAAGAAALLALGEPDAAWGLLPIPADADPTARNYLVERLAAVGADPGLLIRRFRAEPDPSARRALVLALGDYEPTADWAGAREPFARELLARYRTDPDPGMHAAADWLLRQRWGKAAEVAAVDAELKARACAEVVARAFLPFGAAAARPEGADWFVNTEGQTLAVVRGPVEFATGSPADEPERGPNEEPARRTLEHSFAIATKEVTVEQFLRFRPKHEWGKQSSPGPETPAVAVTWYLAAEYCNWLSAREGVAEDQWCYAPNDRGEYAEGMRIKSNHLSMTGYRLPTEAEWECSCRAGAATARPFGRGAELLPRYAWSLKSAENRAWPVGRLRPNDLGLFDTLGNAQEWTGTPDASESDREVAVSELVNHRLHGGSFIYAPAVMRPGKRYSYKPSFRYDTIGFRPARTVRG